MGSVKGKPRVPGAGYVRTERSPHNGTFGFHEKKRAKTDKIDPRCQTPRDVVITSTVLKCSRGKEARTETHARVPSLTHDFMISECGVVRRMSELNLVGYPMFS